MPTDSQPSRPAGDPPPGDGATNASGAPDHVVSASTDRTPGEDEPQEVTEARALTRARVRDLRTLLGKYVRRHMPPAPPRPQPVSEPPRIVSAHAGVLPYLRLVPVVLTLLFIVSFVWDFPGVIISLAGYDLGLDGLLRVLSVSGLIGFLTNWLAISMLFHPRSRRPIFGQGLIPAQRERVIYRLAKAVSEELINEQIIKQKIEESEVIPRYREMALSVTHGVLEDPEFRAELKQLTADYVNSVLGSEEVRRTLVSFTIRKMEEHAGRGISGLALKVYRFVNEDEFQRRIDEAVRALPGSLDTVLDQMDHLLDLIPTKLAERSDEIEEWATKIVLGFVENLDVYSMIVTNMRQYDERQLERLLKNTSNEQLNYIKYLGGVLGFFGGLVIWRPLLALAFFGTVGLILYSIDMALLHRSK